MIGIERRLKELGLIRTGTGGNCEAAESVADHGFYILATDGEAGFPEEGAPEFFIGLFHEDYSEAIWSWEKAPTAKLAEVVAEAFEVRRRVIEAVGGEKFADRGDLVAELVAEGVILEHTGNTGSCPICSHEPTREMFAEHAVKVRS